MRKNIQKGLSMKARMGEERPVVAKLKAKVTRLPAPPAMLRAATGKTRFQPIVASGPGERTIGPEMNLAFSPVKLQLRTLSTTKKRLLWIGDAVVPTGFATVTHSILGALGGQWEVVVSGINYDGSSHRHPYTILPAWQGGDMWGKDRFANLCAEFAPDVVVINNDWWNVADFVKRAPAGLPIVAYMPVDGDNLDPAAMAVLNKLAAAVWYTDYGYEQARAAGFKGAKHVIPHGLDERKFRPVDRTLARKLLELPCPEGAFIVGNVNRNQPRKRLDLTMQYFAEWVKKGDIKDAWLLLHCARKDSGWDLERTARYYGIADRLLLTGSEDLREAAGPSLVQLVYSSLDLQVSTTLGEGWGLTTMEGMACGIPQVVPDWAALGEWAEPAIKVPCSMTHVNPEINTVGAVADKEAFIQALDALYHEPAQRSRMSQQGLDFVRQKRFRWSTVAEQMEQVTRQVMGRRLPVKRKR